MKKTITLVVLLLLAVTTFGQEKKIKVIKFDNSDGLTFSQALGNDRYEIDSLVIVSSVYLGDGWTLHLRDCCEKGRLTGIDMSHCENISEIPACAFMSRKINAPKKTDGMDDKNNFRINLHYITLPNNITKIGDMAFNSTNIEAIEIPYGTEIGMGAFAHCENLKGVVLRGRKLHGENDSNGFYNIAPDAVLYVAPGLGDYYRNSYFWGNFSRVQEGEVAFRAVDVTMNGGYTLKDALGGFDMRVDSMTVSGILNEADMDVLRNNVKYGRLLSLDLTDCVIECGLLYGSRIEYLRMPKRMTKIPDSFLSKSKVGSLTMPESYDEICSYAFEYYKWFPDSTLVVPEGCRKLCFGAFNACKSIKKIVLPSTLETLEPNSLGFNYDLGITALDVDLYVNRMYPPTATTRWEDANLDVSTEQYSGPFSCHDSYKGTKYCRTSTWRLFVPMGAKKNYENDEHWGHIATIIETPLLTGNATGISEAVRGAGSSVADGIYTLDGRFVGSASTGSLTKGLYIVRENGQTRKVVLGR